MDIWQCGYYIFIEFVERKLYVWSRISFQNHSNQDNIMINSLAFD